MSGVDGRAVPVIELHDVAHQFTSRTRIVLACENISMHVDEGEFVAVVGPSGCGKTTVLNMLAGLVEPTRGSVHLKGTKVTSPVPWVGYMTARDGLLPWRTTRENVAFGLEVRGVGRRERRIEAERLLTKVGLGEFAGSYKSQLSQGMRQRAALARTLAIDPDVFLLDEPFAALDAQTKTILQEEFGRIWEETKKTILLVTHDINEAVALADRVLVFSARPGRIKREFSVPFQRPRDLAALHFLPEYVELTREIWEEIRSEINPIGSEQS